MSVSMPVSWLRRGDQRGEGHRREMVQLQVQIFLKFAVGHLQKSTRSHDVALGTSSHHSIVQMLRVLVPARTQ